MQDEHDSSSALAQRLAAIDWSGFDEAYSVASLGMTKWTTFSPDLLLRLSDEDAETACDAAFQLWNVLSHQRVFMSSAALPALPFLLEALESESRASVKDEILDILLGFGECSDPECNERQSPPWVREVRRILILERNRFEVFTTDPCPSVSETALRLLKVLSS